MMLRRVGARTLWLTRGAALFGGAVVTLALVLGLMFGVATMALGANGGNFILGQGNAATARTKLTGNVQGSAMQIINNHPGADDAALNLTVQPGESPMRVTSNGKVANLNADLLDGKDFTSLDAKEVLGGPLGSRGPLPVQGNYTSKGGTLIISASGSGYRASSSARQGGLIGMAIRIDGGASQGFSQVATNERDSHKAFVPATIVLESLPPGEHTIRLEALDGFPCNTAGESFLTYCTTTDNNDFFEVTVVEIPD